MRRLEAGTRELAVLQDNTILLRAAQSFRVGVRFLDFQNNRSKLWLRAAFRPSFPNAGGGVGVGTNSLIRGSIADTR